MGYDAEFMVRGNDGVLYVSRGSFMRDVTATVVM